MATKYLGNQFDIHGGGMDLLFPHHESEIAQSTICNGTSPVRYWIHNNMITINGRKMGKSYNNVIKLTELFSGDHPILQQAYTPMTVRFFILQTHYRSTLDFSNEALQATEKGLKRLMEAYMWLQQLSIPSMVDSQQSTNSELETKVNTSLLEFSDFMNDDFSTARVLANIFELVPIINSLKDKNIPMDSLSASTLQHLQQQLKLYIEDIFGLQAEEAGQTDKLKGVMQVLIELRKEARANKNWALSDKIRNQLAEHGIQLKDEKNGEMSWSIS
jgi:cysteinyl-tRNA synthetase